ncbi:hypothetical protein SMSP2_00058 [Limihaloglobus sulfuriphilus]|uniref:Uncharacterized protein n=1 Tax=Limihaloglobus sulfuriphilus TaxID=1851148 RepID=A0A1Q2MB20_9BACT|nr:hypothetical protein [Limihaloglobus sulfuriphilus]AQQ69728.1 hypothetical protein SMSP2_00058 [Limihaloglobus sulfuriphilus]
MITTTPSEAVLRRIKRVRSLLKYNIFYYNELHVFLKSIITDYFYDRLGRRIKKTVGSLTTWFVYDMMGSMVAESGKNGTGYCCARLYECRAGSPTYGVNAGPDFSYL